MILYFTHFEKKLKSSLKKKTDVLHFTHMLHFYSRKTNC